MELMGGSGSGLMKQNEETLPYIYGRDHLDVEHHQITHAPLQHHPQSHREPS